MAGKVILQKAHAFFKARRYPAKKRDILQHLKCSDATFKRVLKALREEHGAPLVYLREYDGYQYTHDKFELEAPGVWLSPDTLMALVSTQKLLADLNLDFLDHPLAQLKHSIEHYLRKQRKADLQQLDRIRILPINARIHHQTQFLLITTALLQRQCLQITYYARGSNQTSQRIVSPQRLAHYKDNWYLDAWCHLRGQMRMFALDGIRDVRLDDTPCINIAEPELDQLLASGYGIFSGIAQHTATLVFSAQRARWVAAEVWHPNQQASWLDDGRYQLDIPYSDARELLMDIQRHLPEVEVVAPPALKQALLQHLQQAIKQHEKN